MDEAQARAQEEADRRQRLRDNPPALTRATVIAAAAYALMMDGETAPHLAALSPSQFVQGTRHIYAGNGFPFKDDDLRDIHASLRRLLKANQAANARRAAELPA